MACRIVMIASGKGGTGKSTTSVLLGSRLAAMGQKVLLVELDSGLRSVDYISGICGETVYDVQDVLDGRCSCDKAVMQSPLYPNLSVISAPYEGGNVSDVALKALITQIKDHFDTILLDTAAGIGNPFLCAAHVADTCLLVLQADTINLRDGRIVSDKCWESGVKEIRLILNRFNAKRFKKGPIADLDECVDTTCAQLLGVVPESDELQTYMESGKALPVDNPAMLAMTRIARRLMGKRLPLNMSDIV